MNRNPGGSKHYSQVQIQTATKGKLIVLLYQGAIRFMKKALLSMEKKDMEGKGQCLIRAQDIILELLYALDQQRLENGDQLALNLQRLYLYAYRKLVQANLRVDAKPVEEVIGLMASLLEAWEQVAASQPSEGGESYPAGVALTG
jgi:flagellar secretion chaperone FliS